MPPTNIFPLHFIAKIVWDKNLVKCVDRRNIFYPEKFSTFICSLSLSLSCSRWRVVRQTRRFSSTRSQRVTKLWLIWFPPKRAQTEKQLIRYCQSIHLTLPLKISNIIVKIWDQPGLFCLFSSFNQYNNKEKLVLKRSDFKVGDTISIKYYTDTKCHDCIGSFTVECEEKYIVGSDIIENEYLVKFSVEEIIHYLNKNNCKNVVFYLYPSGFTGARVKELLFEVELI